MESRRACSDDRSTVQIKPVVSRRVLAEASIWSSRLHGRPDDAALFLKCVAWQARSPSRRYAYERIQAIWDELGHLLIARG